MENIENTENKQKKPNKFVSVMKAVFVHNIGWKLLALGVSAVIWVLVAGLW